MNWIRHGFPWVPGAAVVAALMLSIGLTLKLPELAKSQQKKPLPELQITNPEVTANAILKERLQLLDPTPLFLPSALSSSRLEYPRADGSPTGNVLQDFGARLVVSEWRAEGAGLSGPRALPSPNDVVATSEVRLPFFGLVRQTESIRPLPDRWGVADIFSTKTNTRIGQLALSTPKQGDFTSSLWSPIELLIIVASDGVIGDPDLLSSSGASEVDDYMVDAIKAAYRMGGDLKPGAYRLVVGP